MVLRCNAGLVDAEHPVLNRLREDSKTYRRLKDQEHKSNFEAKKCKKMVTKKQTQSQGKPWKN